jgi:phosphonatase-like hydrolase
MNSIELVVFDLAGTTIQDNNDVALCLHRAAQDVGVDASLDLISRNIGTNKIHLYQYLIELRRGRAENLEDLEAISLDPSTLELSMEAFRLYEQYMIDHYRQHAAEVPGTSDVFRWLKERGIKIATDTGFHRNVNQAIMDHTGWVAEGLVDTAVDVQHIPGDRGRPAPFMIFHAMRELNVQSVRRVIKVGDQPADMMEGINAGCAGVIGVLSGALDAETLGRHRHTHLLPDVTHLPRVIQSDFSG